MTLRAGVIGWPIAHTRSPKLHGHWLKTYGIDGSYEAIPVQPEELDDFLRGLGASGYRGCNVTIPHKEAAFRRCDRVSARARRIGAVNTIVVAEDGSLDGDNTDAFGFVENLRQAATDDAWRQGPALVLGAGGAGRAVVAGLLDLGVSTIRLTNRNRQRAERLAEDVDTPVTVMDWQDRSALADIALLVNATSLGMHGQPSLDIDLQHLPTTALVNDLVYVPLETPLLAAARARGNPVVDGLGMLLHQARPGFAAWFGVDPVVTDALRAAVLA